MKRFVRLALVPSWLRLLPVLLFAASSMSSVSLFGQALTEETTLEDCRKVGTASTLGTTEASGFGAIASAVGGEGRSSVWELSPFKRGREIEMALGVDPLMKNFPVIDKFVDGTITSIKSLDLAAKSYQNTAALTSKLKSYIDPLAKFTHKIWNNVEVPRDGKPITGRVLELAVPTCKVTPAQRQALQAAIEYGKSVGVVVKIVAL